MIPTIAVGDVHHLCVRRLLAVIPAIDMETRRIEMAERGCQPQTRGCRGGNEAIEGRHAKVIEGIEGTPEGVIIELAGLNARGNEARDRFILKKMGDQVELFVDKAEAVEHHVYRSTVFWTHSATKSCCRSQQTAVLMSDLGGRFVSMPSNQPGLIVSTLKLAKRQAEVLYGVKGCEP